MDGCYMESGIGVYCYIPRLHELLCNENGGALGRHGHGKISRAYKKKRWSLRVDRRNQNRSGVDGASTKLEETAQDFCKFDVRLVPRRCSASIYRCNLVRY